ncbi:class I SAM-dependent methyltransferase [Haladaptatus sp. GCM10025707]|uniref:class I SAM-dependent methyltransferase n=1 Tax=unclassified Haladaptatus TaxID=2622732 RepID=UPI0023E7E369|nr:MULTISPECIES: class I SAM-dependent methyltransferase [unclassified Haladaptatus]
MPTRDTDHREEFRELLVLWAARRAGILDAVMTRAGTPAAVAREADVTERAARITIEALCERGFLKQVGEEYEPTNRALGFFAKTDLKSVGRLSHELDALDRWVALPEAMQSGLPTPEPPEWTVNRLGAHAAMDDATVRAVVTAAVHYHDGGLRVLDVGGGPGTYALEFAARGSDVTLLDAPDVVERDRKQLRHEDIELLAGDYIDSIPGEYDLVFAGGVAHWHGPADVAALVENAAGALAPGGSLVMSESVRGRAANAALVGAHMFAQSERGDTHTEAQFREWLSAASLKRIRVESIPGTDLQVVCGRRAID